MIVSYSEKRGVIHFCGPVTQDAKMGTAKNGNPYAKFSVLYDYEDKPPGETGRRKAIYMNCIAWGDEAFVAAAIEKGDEVSIIGFLEKDEYHSTAEKTVWMTRVVFIAVQPAPYIPEGFGDDDDGETE